MFLFLPGTLNRTKNFDAHDPYHPYHDHIWCPCNGPVGSRINDSTIHRLINVLNMPPISDVGQIFRVEHSRDDVDEILYRYPDMHIRVWGED
jgi:hypothetical protein